MLVKLRMFIKLLFYLGSLKDFNAIEITEGASLLSSMIKNFSEDSNSSINSIVDDDVIELFPSDDCVSKVCF